MGRLLGLGARALREIRDDDGTLWWTIMADPEGNEFCAFPPAQGLRAVRQRLPAWR